jgi:hypothetical protein
MSTSQNLILTNSLMVSIGPCQMPIASRNAFVQPSQRWSGPLMPSHNMLHRRFSSPLEMPTTDCPNLD